MNRINTTMRFGRRLPVGAMIMENTWHYDSAYAYYVERNWRGWRPWRFNLRALSMGVDEYSIGSNLTADALRALCVLEGIDLERAK